MYELLKEFVKPELMILIPVLYLCGVGIKKSQIEDRFIPILLGAISVSLSFLFVVSTSDINGWQEVLMVTFSSITQGILCAGASVYVNQIIKQTGKDE